jgi:hypothetical protein
MTALVMAVTEKTRTVNFIEVRQLLSDRIRYETRFAWNEGICGQNRLHDEEYDSGKRTSPPHCSCCYC